MASATPTRRAIGIVRVSQKKGREGESFVSPEDQRDRIRAACERDGLRQRQFRVRLYQVLPLHQRRHVRLIRDVEQHRQHSRDSRRHVEMRHRQRVPHGALELRPVHVVGLHRPHAGAARFLRCQ